jgi:vacuolar-type H+-ATPase subunit H
MSDQRIQEVLEIEKKAQAIYEGAVKEAEELPLQAEQECDLIMERSRADAEEEARQIITKAQEKEETARTQAEAEEKIKHMESLAKSNFDRAVGYVIERVVGRE